MMDEKPAKQIWTEPTLESLDMSDTFDGQQAGVEDPPESEFLS